MALALPACKDKSHHFEEQQEQKDVPVYNYEVTMADGKVLRAKSLIENTCGVKLEGTDDGQNYMCLQNVKWKKLNNEGCGCSKAGSVVLIVFIVVIVFASFIMI
jgi:hypothetical protein